MRDEEDGDEKQAIAKHFDFQPNAITATKNASLYRIDNIHNNSLPQKMKNTITSLFPGHFEMAFR